MWDERCNTTDHVYGTDPNAFLARVAAEMPKGRTLCVAEVEWWNAAFLAEHGHDVVAVDSSAARLLPN